MQTKPQFSESRQLLTTALITIAAIVVIGAGVWLLGLHHSSHPSTPADLMRWLAYGGCAAVVIVVLVIVLQGIHEIRTTRRVVAESLQGRPPVTDEEFGRQFYTPDTALVAVRLRRLLAENLDCDLSGLIPSDDFARWLELFPGIDSAADCFFEEMAIEFQLSRKAPWPDRFESFDALVKFVVQHSQHKVNARSMVVGG